MTRYFTAAELAAWDRDGFVTVPGLLDRDGVAALRAWTA